MITIVAIICGAIGAVGLPAYLISEGNDIDFEFDGFVLSICKTIGTGILGFILGLMVGIVVGMILYVLLTIIGIRGI